MVADKTDLVEKIKPALGDHSLQNVASDIYKFGSKEGSKILSDASRSIGASAGSLPELHLFDGKATAAMVDKLAGASGLAELGKSGSLSNFQKNFEGYAKQAEAAGLGSPLGEIAKWLPKAGDSAAAPHGGQSQGSDRPHAGHGKGAAHEKPQAPAPKGDGHEKPHAPGAKPDGHEKHHDSVKPNKDEKTGAAPEKPLSASDKAAEAAFMGKLDADGATWWRAAHRDEMLADIKNMTPQQQELYRSDKNFAKMVDSKIKNDMVPILGSSDHDADQLHAAQHELQRVKKGESPKVDDLTTKLYKHAADERWSLPGWAPTSSEPLHQQAALKDLRDAEKKDPSLHDRITKGKAPEDAELRRAAKQALGDEEYQKYVRTPAHK